MARRNFESAIADFTQTIGILTRRVRGATLDGDLSLTESSVLGRLGREGPATTAELARGESMKPQSMSATLTALEGMGLVERVPHATDGRQVHIRLTEKGEQVRNRTRAAKRGWMAEAFLALEEDEKETLFRAGEIMKRMLEK